MAWTFPVIGKTEWSAGSWMPATLTHRGRTHAAVDIYAGRGQAIISPVSGTVRALKSDNIGGNWIQITGDDGNVYYFAHMDRPTTLKKGQKVTGGQQIGAIGNSGSAKNTKTHLHFSVRRHGQAVSPVSLLQSGVVVPDLEFDKTGVAGGSGTPPGAVKGDDYGNMPRSASDSVLPPEAQEDAPAWFEQLQQYREELRNQPAQENPRKIRASEVMRGSLQTMAAMVRNSGFSTSMGEESMEGQMIDREAPERAVSPREEGAR